MAAIALVKTMGSKRFVKAVDEKTTIPHVLLKNLSETMKSCSDLNLNIPGALQAKALRFIKKDGKSDQ
jgi:hypothetical protein